VNEETAMQKPQNSNSIIKRFEGMSREEKAGLALLLCAILLGALVRLLHIAGSGFPINDGGLFYTMTRDLQANGFMIPAETSYNGGGLPFAYPPLGFFLAGWLNSVFGWDLLGLMRWVPLLFNLLCIPVFYLFARRLMKDPVKAGIATLFFALLRPGYEWLIMGGGLTRSPAMLFSLLSLYFYLEMLEAPRRRVRDFILVALTLSLTFLSHLEIGWFTIYSLALLWFFRGRTRRNFVSSVFIMLGGVVLTSPYWTQVIRYHAFQPFLAGLASGGGNPFLSFFELLYFNFTEELIFPVLAAIALAGVVISLVKREYLLPLWLVLNAILDARSVNRSDVIPAAMLISVGIVDGVYVLIAKYKQAQDARGKPIGEGEGIFSRAGMLVLYILCAQVLLTAYLFRPMDPSLSHIPTKGDIQAMAWVNENTPREAEFVVVPSSTWWETDAVGEWFPALAGRTNLLTVQGSEWLPGYQQRIANFKEISSQIASGSFDIQTFLRDHPGADFLYLPLTGYRDTVELVGIRADLPGFPMVFSNPDVEIYQLRGE
jgi:hypothetical protein